MDFRQDKEEQKQESDIFGPSKSAAELKAGEKVRLEDAKRQAKLDRETAKQQKKNGPRESNPVLWVTVGILAVVVLLIGVLLVIQTLTGGKDPAPDTGRFYNTEELPEMSQEGIKGVISEAYYTKDGHLAVILKLSNAYPTKHFLTSLEVKLNNEAGDTIATGYTDKIPDNYAVPANSGDPNSGYNTFTFYISPEFVKIKDDPLTTLTYEVKTTGKLEDENATVSPEYTTAATTAQ